VVFGASSFFLFKDPPNETKAEVSDDPSDPITYEFAEQEVMEQEDKFQLQQQELLKKQQEEET
jgi:hypothetical protein